MENKFSLLQSTITLVLLHGRRFSSKTWVETKTIQTIAAAGFRVVAIDLPGFISSPECLDIEDKGMFLHKLIKILKITNPVIVSPSYSGCYSIPLLIENQNIFHGFIPIAPICHEMLLRNVHSSAPEKFNQLPKYFKRLVQTHLTDLSFINIPTLVVYGEHDRSVSSAILSLIPKSKSFEILGGQHPAYLKNPVLWNTIVYNFLNQLNCYE